MKSVVLLLLAACAFPSSVMAKEWTHVRVGIEGGFPPWNATNTKGELEGFDVDLIRDLCDRARLECELVSGEWSGMIPGLVAGKFDLIMTLGINEKRKKSVDFTIPYAKGVTTFLALKNGPVGELPESGRRVDLNDKPASEPVIAKLRPILAANKIGVVDGTTQEEMIETYFGSSQNIRTYRNSVERDMDIRAGRIDLGCDSGVYGTTMLSKPENSDLVMTGPFLTGAMLATDVGMGMRKGEADLKSIFDAAITSAADDGTIRKLSVKWSKLDLTPSR